MISLNHFPWSSISNACHCHLVFLFVRRVTAGGLSAIAFILIQKAFIHKSLCMNLSILLADGGIDYLHMYT